MSLSGTARMAALACVLAVCAGGSTDARSGDSTTEVVSMIRLTASPEKFAGKRVRVGGYCHLSFESDALYLHREDFLNRLAVNALKLDLGNLKGDQGDRSGRYVIVEGVFAELRPDDPRPYGGLIRAESLDVIPAREKGGR